MAAQVKKHIKRTKEQEGGIVSIEAPLHVSNVQVLDPVTGCAPGCARTAAQRLAECVVARCVQRRRAHSVPLPGGWHKGTLAGIPAAAPTGLCFSTLS